MYRCNNCGKEFKKSKGHFCPHCGSDDYVAGLGDVVAEADDKNKEKSAAELKVLGDEYITYQRKKELTSECMKDVLERAKDAGITKEMLLAYVTAAQLEEYNTKVLFTAINNKEVADGDKSSE